MTLKAGVMMLKIQLCITDINYILKYITTRIPEMLGRFLNLNKMKTKTFKSHEPIFYSQ